MAEWSKAVVLKAIVCKYRGFESLFARKKCYRINLARLVKLVNTADLKSAPYGLPVQVRQRVNKGKVAERSKAHPC